MRDRAMLAGVFLSAAVFFEFFGGCGPKEKVVSLALAVPLTGDMGTEGQGIRRAVEMAIAEANESHRFPFKLAIKALDDRADPKEAVNAANLIVSDPSVIAVIGHYNSGCAIPAAKVYGRAGLPMLAAAATNPELTLQQLKPDWMGPRVVFRIMSTDDVQGGAAAEFAFNKLKLRKMAVIHDKSPYGEGLADRFKQAFEKLGAQVQSFDGIVIGDKDFKALLTRIQSQRPDGVYFGGLYAEAGLLLKQSKELGFKTAFISGDGSKTDSIYSIAGDSADGAYFTMVGVPVENLPAAQEFVERYHKRYPGPETPIKPYDHFCYEAAQIVFKAMEKSGPDRSKLLQALRQTRYQGMLGLTTFDDIGDTLNKVISVSRAEFKTRGFVQVQ